MDTFTPPWPPTVSSSVTFTARVLQANFGDGYEQTVADGLNTVSGTYTLEWDILSVADRDTIESFFSTHQGAQAFQYTIPSESTARKFKCKTWTRTSSGALYAIRAELREVFDLA